MYSSTDFLRGFLSHSRFSDVVVVHVESGAALRVFVSEVRTRFGDDQNPRWR